MTSCLSGFVVCWRLFARQERGRRVGLIYGLVGELAGGAALPVSTFLGCSQLAENNLGHEWPWELQLTHKYMDGGAGAEWRCCRGPSSRVCDVLWDQHTKTITGVNYRVSFPGIMGPPERHSTNTNTIITALLSVTASVQGHHIQGNIMIHSTHGTTHQTEPFGPCSLMWNWTLNIGYLFFIEDFFFTIFVFTIYYVKFIYSNNKLWCCKLYQKHSI